MTNGALIKWNHGANEELGVDVISAHTQKRHGAAANLAHSSYPLPPLYLEPE